MGRIKSRVRRAVRRRLKSAAERWCPACEKRVPPFHLCSPKSDFGRRRTQAERASAAERRRARAAKRKRTAKSSKKARKPRENHPYQWCTDPQCPRPLCKAFKEGIQACPLPHG